MTTYGPATLLASNGGSPANATPGVDIPNHQQTDWFRWSVSNAADLSGRFAQSAFSAATNLIDRAISIIQNFCTYILQHFQNAPDSNDFQRFLIYQNQLVNFWSSKTQYEQALCELVDGQKRGYWCWFIFPILDGRTDRPSDRCKYFAFKSRQDVQNFWSDPTLRSRLESVCNTINQHKNKNIGIKTILGGGEMGQTDSFKLHVCVTLFAQLTGHSVFHEVLNNFYSGKPDTRTQHLITHWPKLRTPSDS